MKQAISALIVIIIAASLATMGTLASFSDTETSPGNYFETGSLDLQLKDADEDYGVDPLGDSVTMTWDYIAQGYGDNGGLNPGDSLVGTVWLRNVATDDASRLDISCFTQNFDEEGNPTFDGGKDTAMRIDKLTYTYDSTVVAIVWGDGTSWNPEYIADMDEDDRITLHDWVLHDICGLTPPAVDSEATLYMMVTFDPPDPNPYAGHETIMTLTFQLFQ